ncbi:MAG: hypothetical protein NTU83_10520 [Candidatus Hydrogenedentes bacterium]|nr:hypothetical protein [Candidatus Hydrogenedentota bacterium]
MNVLLVCVQPGLDSAGAKYLHHFLIENGHESTLLYLPGLHLGPESSI